MNPRRHQVHKRIGIGATCVVIGWFALVADIVTAQTSVDSPAAAEVVRLMEVVHEKRGGIEAERTAELRSVTAAYRKNLQAIDPKDMFESESEYHARRAREKSEVELERVASINAVHRTYDDRLMQEVEPLIQRVQELLSSEDIVPRDAIQFHLETYDAESHLFHGILKIESPVAPTDALIHFPMKRADARVFWGNRQSLVPQVRVSLDLWSLTIGLTRFGLDDAESGLTTRVFVVPRPPVGQPPAGKVGVVSGFKATAGDLAERAAEVSISDSSCCGYPQLARGLIGEYNRLIGEAKGVFAGDAFVQSLQEIGHYGNQWQAARSVAPAARGLHAYLTSFVPSDGVKATAGDLAERAAEVSISDSSCCGYPQLARGLIGEYNRLIGEAKGVFAGDASVQSLREIRYHQGGNRQAVEAVGIAARRLGRIVENISDVPMALEIRKEPIVGKEFDYLPYSGRFSEGARTLESELRRGFSTSATDEYGNTDLHYAASRGLPGLASALLDAGADPRARNNRAVTPLHYAYVAITIAADIISRGVAIDAESDGGWTPLHYTASSDDRVQVAELLIGQGAAVHVRGGDSGWTPLDRAIDREAPKLIELLGRHGASCNVKC